MAVSSRLPQRPDPSPVPWTKPGPCTAPQARQQRDVAGGREQPEGGRRLTPRLCRSCCQLAHACAHVGSCPGVRGPGVQGPALVPNLASGGSESWLRAGKKGNVAEVGLLRQNLQQLKVSRSKSPAWKDARSQRRK